MRYALHSGSGTLLPTPAQKKTPAFGRLHMRSCPRAGAPGGPWRALHNCKPCPDADPKHAGAMQHSHCLPHSLPKSCTSFQLRPGVRIAPGYVVLSRNAQGSPAHRPLRCTGTHGCTRRTRASHQGRSGVLKQQATSSRTQRAGATWWVACSAPPISQLCALAGMGLADSAAMLLGSTCHGAILLHYKEQPHPSSAVVSHGATRHPPTPRQHAACVRNSCPHPPLFL
jgi:hypothetical protein